MVLDLLRQERAHWSVVRDSDRSTFLVMEDQDKWITKVIYVTRSIGLGLYR